MQKSIPCNKNITLPSFYIFRKSKGFDPKSQPLQIIQHHLNHDSNEPNKYRLLSVTLFKGDRQHHMLYGIGHIVGVLLQAYLPPVFTYPALLVTSGGGHHLRPVHPPSPVLTSSGGDLSGRYVSYWDTFLYICTVKKFLQSSNTFALNKNQELSLKVLIVKKIYYQSSCGPSFSEDYEVYLSGSESDHLCLKFILTSLVLMIFRSCSSRMILSQFAENVVGKMAKTIKLKLTVLGYISCSSFIHRTEQ